MVDPMTIEQLMALLQTQQGQQQQSPTMAGITAGGKQMGDILSQILAPKTIGEKSAEWSLEERKKLMAMFGAMPGGVSEGEQVKEQAGMNKIMGPAFDKIAFNHSRMAGGPQAGRNMGIDIGSLLANSQFDLRRYMTGLGEQRKQFKFGGMAGLT